MSEEQWAALQVQLGAAQCLPAQEKRPCVQCWYDATPETPFPAEASSSLCPRHARQVYPRYRSHAPGECP